MASLYQRIRAHGSITEAASDVPDATFALPATLNWMRAEAILAEDITFRTAKAFYCQTQRMNLTNQQLNSVLEQLLFSLHQLSALRVLSLAPNKADVARVGIVTWYYGIYGAASAMIAATDGSFPETHAATARVWDRQIVQSKLVMPPFSDRIRSLIDADAKEDLALPKKRGQHPLTKVPKSTIEAWGCHAEYLSGTVKWEQWNASQKVRNSKEFKQLKVDDFRTQKAKNLRDEEFRKKSISFLHQAYRYRGKANYRDAIYLAYGKTVSSLAQGFIDDLIQVLTAFSAMAAGYCSLRMGKDKWSEFIDDLEANRSISISPLTVWS